MLSSHSHALPHAADRHGWASAPNACSRPLPNQAMGHCRGIQGASVHGWPQPGGASQSTLGHGIRRQRNHMQLQAIASESLPGRDVLSGEYDAAANASVWERRPVPVISRLISIGVEFIRWQISNPDDPPARDGAVAAGLRSPRKSRRAAAMRELLVKLGPAFVKIGQALSSRPDVLPPAYLVELEALQDRIPAFETSQAFIVLEDELGAPLPSVFREISPQPIAAASLGQVYRAVLARDGQVVAVKVQRPGVAEAIALDVYILRWLAAAFRQLRKLNTDLPALVDEWATSLFRELDYRREARNAERFKELYSSLDGVYVPAVLPELTTTKVLTMEWVDGERLRTVADNLAEATDPISIRRTSGARASTSGSVGNRGSSKDLELVEVGVRCSLEQMLEQGFYHADPHPGNLMRTRDGKLAYLDFGMCGELDAKTSQALIRATLHLVNREFSSLAQDFIDLGLLPPGSDKDKIIPALTGVFQTALARGVSNVSFGDLSGQLGRTMYQFSFRIPPYYTLLVRSLTVLEGIALASDPNYKVLGSAYPWIARRLLTNRNPELQETLRALLYTPAGNFRFARLESLLQEAVRVPRDSPQPQGPAPPGTELRPGQEGSALSLLLSPDASFVRDILVDELAKGIDAGWRVSVDQALNAARHPLPYVAGVPVFGSFLVPLLTPLTTHVPASAQRFGSALSSWASGTFGSTPQHRLEDQELAGPVGALLAALPELSSRRDKEQVAGLQRLATALAALVAKRAQATAATSQSPMLSAVGEESPGGLAGLLAEPAAAFSQLQQTVEGLRWFIAELGSLPQAQRDEAMKLPAELAARLASRITARAIRGLFGEKDDTSIEEVEEVVITTPVAGPAPVVVVNSNTGNARAFGGMQDTLAGSSIV